MCSQAYASYSLYTGNGSAVSLWTPTPLNSNAGYCNGNYFKLKCYSIKGWANTEEVQECITTLRNNKSSRMDKQNTFFILSFLCLKENPCYFHPLTYFLFTIMIVFHFTVHQHSAAGSATLQYTPTGSMPTSNR